MNYFLTLLFLIKACIVGICLALFLNIRSYFLIAVICVIIFICIELFYNYKLLQEEQAVDDNINIFSKTNINLNSIFPKSGNSNDFVKKLSNGNSNDFIKKLSNGNSNDFVKYLSDSNSNDFVKYLSDQNTTDFIKQILSILSSKTNVDLSMKTPFDSLEPNELVSRLNYIYYVTANPTQVINYNDFKTSADKLLEQDGIKLSTNDVKLQTITSGFYPQLTSNQIDATDCLNEGSGPRSCFQSPKLFQNILDKGVNLDNVNLIIAEDFTKEHFTMQKNPFVLFYNAQNSNLDKPLDQESNETINLSDTKSLCHNCKLAVCKDNYCSLQNNLFM